MPDLARKRSPAPQPRPDLADQLERVTPRLDRLTQRARLGYDVAGLHDLEEEAWAIAGAIVAPFRGKARF